MARLRISKIPVHLAVFRAILITLVLIVFMSSCSFAVMEGCPSYGETKTITKHGMKAQKKFVGRGQKKYRRL